MPRLSISKAALEVLGHCRVIEGRDQISIIIYIMQVAPKEDMDCTLCNEATNTYIATKYVLNYIAN